MCLLRRTLNPRLLQPEGLLVDPLVVENRHLVRDWCALPAHEGGKVLAVDGTMYTLVRFLLGSYVVPVVVSPT